MCGRYYINEDTIEEIRPLVRKMSAGPYPHGDIHPSENAGILREEDRCLSYMSMAWGYPCVAGKGLIINARAESIEEKKMFREDILSRRCLIPASGFYEWDREKNRFSFTGKDNRVLLLAGCFGLFPEGERFTIITTSANESVLPVHERMPLILKKEEITKWFSPRGFRELLIGRMPLLNVKCEYEQTSLFER